jgi:stearoyl-CoA desaturase (delta-9 desaturase)
VGGSFLVWSVFLRTVLVWHITWSVNSLAHVWGYQRYDTGDSSRNNLFVGYVSNGEGWHNNHHADPRSARHGHAWWELDVTWLTIRLLGAVGLARRIAAPRTELMAAADTDLRIPRGRVLAATDSSTPSHGRSVS